VVASDVEIADTRAARRRGLLGRRRLPAGSALILTPCHAIHTFGMQFTIDVAFVDSRGRVRKVVRELPPWRVAAALLGSTAIEFPAGVLEAHAVAVGDQLYVSSAPA
jgi:uncharacterized membrane protein (UPF0127 family)